MKKATTFKIGEKEYSMVFDCRSLASMERSLGRSILSIFANTPSGMLQSIGIDVLVSAIRYGIKDIGEEDPYDFLQRYCDEGGDVDTFGGIVTQAFLDTGLFTKGKAPQGTENPKAEKSVPSKNG